MDEEMNKALEKANVPEKPLTETLESRFERMAVLASEGKMRPGVKKFPKEKLFKVVDDMLAWFIRNQDQFMVINYFADPDTQKEVSYKQLKNAMRYRDDLRDYYDSLMEMLASRVAGLALMGGVDPTFSKYYLSSRFKGWQEQSRVSTEVNVTTRVIDFKWRDTPESQGDLDDSE